MSYSISEINGVKIYNLSAGKTTPQFMEQAQQKGKSLRYDLQFRRRIELIQDFDFPVSCTQVAMSADQRYIIASGVYAPQFKIFETSDLGMKCMRGIDSEIVQFCLLSDDYKKLAFACSDRNIEFHAQYGRHYKTRIPQYPRDILFNPFTCDLLVSASSPEIYRISLDEGQFLSSFVSAAEYINTLNFNQEMNLLIAGGQKGIIDLYDYRQRNKVRSKIFNLGEDITALASDSTGLVLAVGSANGVVRIHDLRHDDYITEIKHNYKFPINKIDFHQKSQMILSSTKRSIRINKMLGGQLFTSVEPKSEINSFQLVQNSGLILIAGEEPRIGTYFIPQLDVAPQWVPFLENITEELEEQMNTVVYDQFKFVSPQDLQELNATHLLGTKMLKPSLNGYLIHVKLYNKLRAQSNPFEYEQYKKNLLENKLEQSRGSRINVEKDGPQINQDLLEEWKKKAEKNKKKAQTLNKQGAPEIDQRFIDLFKQKEFIINKNDEAFLRAHPNQSAKAKQNKLFNDRFNNTDGMGDNDENEDGDVQFGEDIDINDEDLQQKKVQKVQQIIQNDPASKLEFQQQKLMNDQFFDIDRKQSQQKTNRLDIGKKIKKFGDNKKPFDNKQKRPSNGIRPQRG